MLKKKKKRVPHLKDCPPFFIAFNDVVSGKSLLKEET